ncbi:VOC family protein [Allonocardiopsis opalescens]|uniref:Glyoxylase I family protein n=1 Tax=Allonocardiopsis opalescens TaxID=1144618 RepID=A0A2T0PZV0_9ACTN|nr:VOC family protein [Allonocardiopsis opalescens]PRX97082.1 glyoxylase I family protein [Allonocardiopsis opalescens]
MPDQPAMRWSHVGLNCGDQAATEDFYRTLFGFQRARVADIGGGERIIFLRSGPVYLELFPSAAEPADGPKGDGPQSPGVIRHLAFQTDDLDAFLERIGDSVPVTLGPLRFDEFIPGWRTVWLSDPDGVVVEVSQGYRDQEQVPTD